MELNKRIIIFMIIKFSALVTEGNKLWDLGDKNLTDVIVEGI